MSLSNCALPFGLVDLTLTQTRQTGFIASHSPLLRSTAQRVLHREICVFRRRSHALALKPITNSGRHSGGRGGHAVGPIQPNFRDVGESQLYKFGKLSPPAAQLRYRVDELISKPVADVGSMFSPVYDEDELQSVYADLLSHPETGTLRTIDEPSEAANNAAILENVVQRLIAVTHRGQDLDTTTLTLEKSLSARLAARRLPTDLVNDGLEYSQNPTNPSLDEAKLTPDTGSMPHIILSRLGDIMRSLEQAKDITAATSVAPVYLLSRLEWNALVHVSLEKGDFAAAEYSLDLMRQLGNSPPEELVNDVLGSYATRGDVRAIEAFLSRYTDGKPTERQRDLHIKAHLTSSSPDYNLDTALATLHNYEALALLPPIPSYTRLISALFSAHSAQCTAQAWDLFAHMRYVAHAKPDGLLYALMIRACAGTGASHSGYAAEPERALDLWREMREDARLAPTVGAYNAVILACARSKEFSSDAFRLAKEMLDAHRDAFGSPRMKPDRATFAALLVAAKTRADLPRARWILAEMLKFVKNGNEAEREAEITIDEKVMLHVFHAYASYRPPFRRGNTKIVEEQATMDDAISADTSTQAVQEIPQEVNGRFGVTPPQTPAEVVTEAKALFERVLQDQGKCFPGTSASSADQQLSSGVFTHVGLTSSLLNSFLSIYYNHAPLEDTRPLFEQLFNQLGVQRNSRTYVEALERCANTSSGEERATSNAFAQDIWADWMEVEKDLHAQGSVARLIERAHVAMIRIYVLAGDLNCAMALVREFVRQYPPHAVSVPHPKPMMRASRTVLFAPRPLIRLTSPSEVQDDMVPPLLTFRDLELLHHKLVISSPQRTVDLSYVKFLCKAYESALRRRRDMTIRS